jgi:hypothetical protein
VRDGWPGDRDDAGEAVQTGEVSGISRIQRQSFRYRGSRDHLGRQPRGTVSGRSMAPFAHTPVSPPVQRDFIVGHDQRAIHERIAKVGSIREFLDLFDKVRTEAPS